MLTLEKKLKIDDKICKEPNLTSRFSEVDLGRIAEEIHSGYLADERSRDGWRKVNAAGMDLAMQISKTKSFPWPNCSNVNFPLITIAALQFHARAYPAIVSGSDVVRCKVSGFDPDPEEVETAERVGKYMSYEVLEVDQSWEEGQDRLLLNYAVVGCTFKKTFRSPVLGYTTSQVVYAQDLVLDYYAESVETCRRKTHILQMNRNDIIEGIRATTPIYRNVEAEPWFAEGGTNSAIQQTETTSEPRRDGTVQPQRTQSTPFTMLEQHCWLDLDGDGYEEPYIITIESASRKVLRIVARWDSPTQVTRNARNEIVSIRSMEYFTKYGFIPSADGSIYDMGFGRLLGPLNESVNTSINQLNDAGTMALTAGGFLGRGAKIRGGVYTFAPFEWKRVDSTGEDLAKSIYQLPVREPSAVLFQLLGLLIDFTNRISGATETMVGESPGQNTPAETSRSMVEQGMKVYAAIFKRTWRAMKEEFRKRYILNGLYAPLKYRSLFLGDPSRICPAADPNISSDAERFQRAAAIAARSQQVPGYNSAAVEENYLRSLKVDDWKKYYQGIDPNAPPPKDPRVQVAEINAQSAQLKLQASQQEFVATLMEERRLNQASMAKTQAEIVLLLAKAEGEADNKDIVRMQMSLAAMKQQDERIRGQVDHYLRAMELISEPDRKGVPSDTLSRVVSPPADSASPPPLGGPAGGTAGAMV
jgi:chaperonin GroES